MNLKDKEKLVLTIASGRNTYKALRHEFPGLASHYWLHLDVAKTNPIITDERQLEDGTAFILNRAGEDLLYQLEKERRQTVMSAASLVSSVLAAIMATISTGLAIYALLH